MRVVAVRGVGMLKGAGNDGHGDGGHGSDGGGRSVSGGMVVVLVRTVVRLVVKDLLRNEDWSTVHKTNP